MITPVGSSFAEPVRRRSAGGGEFRLAAPTAAAADHTAAVAPASLAGLLSLQETADDGQDRRTLKHGQALLSKLSRLQRAILSGGSDHEVIEELAALGQTSYETADPRLRALIGSVLLRAKIELAKRGH